MIAQVTDCAESSGAVRMRSPLSRRSRLKVLTALAMLSSAILLAVDKAERLPLVVDCGALVVDQSGCEPDLLHRREVEVGLDLRGLLGPGDPEAVRRGQRLLQRRKPTLQLRSARREKHEHLDAGFRSQLRA